ncbi:hypothetical protein ABT061_46125 [Streptosporangium sp. NPDC002544]|uniref:hypothetical protein n=1 Tax=Streptosporangium sp. NPDC002544 TaxID=3154538 RepID=UPI00332CFA1D
MPKALALMFTDVSAPGDEAAFNEWYRDTHLPEVLAQVPGIVGASRYVAAPESVADMPGGRRYLAVYRIEADDPRVVMTTLRERIADGSIGITETLRTDPPPLSLVYLSLEGDGLPDAG